VLKAAVTVGCAAAMAAAAMLTVRLRRTRRTPSPLSGGEPFGERLAVTVGRGGGMVAGAILAGVLSIGAGSRLMMRVLAVTSPDEVQGRLTEADEVIGNVSFGGSAFLILAVGIGSGVLGLAIFASLRRWLPDRSLAAGLLGVAIGAGALVRPSGFLAASNIDFSLLSPAAVAVALCLATLVLFGSTFAVLVDHLAPRWPRPAWSPRGVLAVAPFAVLLLAPPLFVGTVVAVLVGTVTTGLRSRAADADADVDAVDAHAAGAATRVGRTLVVALGGIGAASVVVAAGQVLAA
jgi:hypothetical protein